MLDIGANIIKGIWQGIDDKLDWIYSKILGLGDKLTSKVKKAFGISSPSKRFRDEVGVNLARGLGLGFEREMESVADDMQNSIPVLDVSGAEYNMSGSAAQGANYYQMVAAFKEALQEVNVELEGAKVGKFVTKTVTKAIYT
jgi:phage-related protein